MRPPLPSPLARLRPSTHGLAPPRPAAAPAPARPAPPCRTHRRPLPHPPTAVLTDRGRALTADSVVVLGRSLGEGSYGQVYEGALADGTRVVLKRCKPRVENARDFFDAEHVLNVYASKAAPRGVAPFLGFIEVEDGGTGAARAGSAPRPALTPGTWLVWRYEGGKTLAYFLRRRDCDAVLAADLGVHQDAVAATVLFDVLTALKALHGAGVVHRDVKPANLVLAEPAAVAAENEAAARRRGQGTASSSSTSSSTTAATAPRFKLIDLGAAADLRRGTNYDPQDGVLDPLYAPPERFILPTAGPALGAAPIPGAAALLGSVLWRKHAPDTFDAFSCGCLLLQLAVPRLRTASALRAFRATLADRYGGDLEAWWQAEGCRLPTCALDADGGAGWELAAALLKARTTATDGDGGVEFVGAAGRPTAAAALGHRFMKQAVPLAKRRPGVDDVVVTKTSGAAPAAPPPPPTKKSSLSLFASAASSVVRRATRRLFDLEAALVAQAGAVEAATTRVETARARGAPAADVRAAEAELEAEQGRLKSLAAEFQSTATKASDALASFWGGAPAAGGGAAPTPPPPADVQAAANPVRDAAVGGVYNALKFTGVALKVASALASTVATRAAAADGGVDPAAPSVERADGLAFVDALRELTPPPAPGADYDRDVAPRLKRDPRAARLPPGAARGLYAAYADALARAAAVRAADAAAAYRALLVEVAPPPAVPWLDAEPALARDARYAAAVTAGVDVRAEFEAFREAAAAEGAFRDLLADTLRAADPRKRGRWSAVRPLMVDDPRFGPVAELRRRELFAETQAALAAARAAAEAAAAEAAAAADREAAARADALAELARTRAEVAEAAAKAEAEEQRAADGEAEAEAENDDDDSGNDTVAALRAERERLRAEYEEMERRLREMEADLALGE